MSDFGELCPLFETGVFKEITFPAIRLTDITASGNALWGTQTAAHAGYFTFGRTVVVTEVYVRRTENTTVKGETNIHLNILATELAANTIFGTFTASTTTDGADNLTWGKGVVTAQTFTSSDILGISVATGTAASGGIFDFILRYKEK